MARIKIYTTPYCGYCTMAKALLSRKGIPYEEVDLAESTTLRSWLVDETGTRTVPQIFLDGASIGGFKELAVLDRTGELDERLRRTEAALPSEDLAS
jgi:glutaredoxin 3